MHELELKIVRFFNRIGNNKINEVVRFISSIRFLAVFWLVIVIISYIIQSETQNLLIKRVIVVTILHFGISEAIMKHLASKIFPIRTRPYLAYPGIIKPIGRQFSDSSIPSSHMTSTIAMIVVLLSIHPSYWPIAGTFGVFMAFTRLHTGMHYPSDVFVGVVLGLAYGWLALYLIP